jgi:hypothetical protein
MQMSEGRARFVDAMCKIAGIVALIAGGVWTIIAYTGHLHEVKKAEEIEAWKPYLSKRLDPASGSPYTAGAITGSSAD